MKERKEQSARDDKDWDREPEQSNASKKAVTRRCTVEMTSTDRYEPKVAINTKVKVGHVHLNVADLERSVAFYRDVLGFRVLLWLPKLAFLSAGDYPQLGLDTRATEGGKPPEPGITGLHHYALQHPTREALASTVSRAVRGYGSANGRLHYQLGSVYPGSGRQYGRTVLGTAQERMAGRLGKRRRHG